VTDDTYIVNFCDCAPAGALRIDQLRSVALGHAMSCLLETTGAHVERQRQIADIGREFGKTSAAYLTYANGLDPAATGEKSDHFVGRMCGLYDKEERGHDLADSLFARFSSGEQEASTVWRLIRGWTLSGQNETLSRLGVCFQRVLFYSELAPQTKPLLRLARAQGLYRPEWVAFECRAADESTTQSGMNGYALSVRCLYELTIWRSVMIEFPGAVFVRVTGDEQHEDLEEHLHALVPGAPAYPSTIVYKSSLADCNAGISGDSGPAVDDLLDTLATREELRALVGEGRPLCSAHDLAAMVLLGAALGKAPDERFEVSERHLLWADVNPGWILAQAWARACATAHDGDSVAMLSKGRRRFLTSKELRPLVDRAVETLDVLELLEFLVQIATSYLNGATDQTSSEQVCALLGAGLQALGLVGPAGSLKGVG
jgi:tRNA synthetases class I (R)